MEEHRQEENPEKPPRSGDVPDWFEASEESQPVVVTPPFSLPEDDLIESTAPSLPVTTSYSTKPPSVPIPASVRPQYSAENLNVPEEEIEEEDELYEDEELEEAPYMPPVQTTRRQPRAAQRVAAEPTRGTGCADAVTAIFLLMTIGVCSLTVLLLANPQSSLNPLRWPTYEKLLVLASPPPSLTPSKTFTPLPDTPTPLPSLTPTGTATATATLTPTITDTPVVAQPSSPTTVQTKAAAATTPPPQYTLSPFPFTVDSLRYSANGGPDGCSYQSVAVTVRDLALKPLPGITIKIQGSGGTIDEVKFTGTAKNFGDGGAEFFLGPIPREDSYTVQLLGKNGSPISDPVQLRTRTKCTEVVAIINFVQNHTY